MLDDEGHGILEEPPPPGLQLIKYTG